MSGRLKPLLLPQKVELEKLREEEHQRQHLQESQQSAATYSPIQDPPTDGDLSSYVYCTRNSSASDLACSSPATPTFSRSGHSRASGSSSSLEVLSPSCSESSASPAQLAQLSAKAGKRPLPDVQEEPLEKEEGAPLHVSDPIELYHCLCDRDCMHCHDASLTQGVLAYHAPIRMDDYDLGFLSDGDFNNSVRSPRRRRAGTDAALSAWSARVGWGLKSLARWKSPSRRAMPSLYPASEPSLDCPPSLSRAPSSRSSSKSAQLRRRLDRADEISVTRPSTIPSSPALSPSDSVESLGALTDDVDMDAADVHISIERERALATTPLLPPLLAEIKTSFCPPTAQASPLQSPTVESPVRDAPVVSPPFYSSPPLCTRASHSSFFPVTSPVSPSSATVQAPSPPLLEPVSPTALVAMPPRLMEHQDEWSDRLGHANFTITPKPYAPEDASLEAIRNFQANWEQARINYTKHLVRTGEHYGITSNTYALTEAKWAEVERQWQLAHTDLVSCVSKTANEGEFAALQWCQPREDMSPAAVPRMLDAEKFPERGDEDIVGPMVREVAMSRDTAMDDRKNSASLFWKSIAEKLGRRR